MRWEIQRRMCKGKAERVDEVSRGLLQDLQENADRIS
jgi:hypothetical protein